MNVCTYYLLLITFNLFIIMDADILKLAEERKDYTISTKIENVVRSDNFADRVTLVLSDEIAQVSDLDPAKLDIKDKFSKNCYELIKQLAPFSPHAVVAQASAMGKMVNPLFFSYLLNGAEITIKRVFCKKGTPRRDGVNGEYPKDQYTTIIAGLVPHINPLFTNGGNNSLLMQAALNPVTRPNNNGAINTDNI